MGRGRERAQRVRRAERAEASKAGRFGGIAELGPARRGGRRARGARARATRVGRPRRARDPELSLERSRPGRPWEPGGGGAEPLETDSLSVPSQVPCPPGRFALAFRDTGWTTVPWTEPCRDPRPFSWALRESPSIF